MLGLSLLDFVFNLTLLTPESVVIGAVLRLTLAETDADVTLELDGVGVGELEGVEDGGEVAVLPVVLPVAENVRIRSAAVVVSHLEQF